MSVLSFLARFLPPPREIRNSSGDVFLHRWHIIPRNRFMNVYLHNFILSDDADRGHHSHPWFSLSLILSGGYFDSRQEHWGGYSESMIGEDAPWVSAGSLIFRGKNHLHRVVLEDGVKPWSVFITGPYDARGWGYVDERGNYTDQQELVGDPNSRPPAGVVGDPQ